MTNKMEDEFAKMVADADQAGEAVKLITPILWSYFESLVDQGFTREEALVMTIALQQSFQTKKP